MKSFQDMALPEELLKALVDLKFENPTKIQAAVIPASLKRTDIIACAETGSGKTGAFGIPIVARLIEEPQARALILAPTRELAMQISDVMADLTKHARKLKIARLVGGADIRKQFRVLKTNPSIIVATPGRLIDHLNRGSINLNKTETLILDEGDRMLDMGFSPQLREIQKHLPKNRQTSLFTATFSDKVQKLAKNYLTNPEKIAVGAVSRPVSSIKQSVIEVTFKEKDNRIIDELNERKGSVIVFTRTKRRTDILANILDSYGFDVDLIHGGRTQGQRNKAIRNFKEGKSRILCATDVAARGIDVPHVEHVINFDLPMMEEDYVHRIGRTARNGATGEAVSFVTPEEHYAWNDIARKYKIIGVELKGTGRRPSKSGGAGNRRGRSSKPDFFARKRKGNSDNSEGSSRFGNSKKRSFSKSSDSFEDRYSKKKKSFDFDSDDYRGGDSKPKRSFSRNSDEHRGGSSKKKRSFSRDFDNSRDDRPPKKRRSFSRDGEDSRQNGSSKTRSSFSRDSEGSRQDDRPSSNKRRSFSSNSDDSRRDDRPSKKKSFSAQSTPFSKKKKSKFSSKSGGGAPKRKSSAPRRAR